MAEIQPCTKTVRKQGKRQPRDAKHLLAEIKARYDKWKLAVQKSMGWHFGDKTTAKGNKTNDSKKMERIVRSFPGTAFLMSVFLVLAISRSATAHP